MNYANSLSLCVTLPFLRILIILTAKYYIPVPRVNSYLNPSTPYGCKHELAVYVNFTSPLAFLKMPLWRAPDANTPGVPDAFHYVWGQTFISPAQTFLLSKHVYKVMICDEICSPDFQLLVNMFSHLRHFTLLLSSLLRKQVRFIFQWVKIHVPLTRYRPILAWQRGPSVISTDVRLCRHHS